MAKIIYPTPSGIVAGTIPAGTADRERELKFLAGELGFGCTFLANQVHSDIVLHCKHNHSGDDGDAAVCTIPGTLLGVFTADCVPILIYGRQVTGFIHAGWRGFRANIIEHFFTSFPEATQKLSAIIAPAICQNCYEVGPEMAIHFQSPELEQKSYGKFYLDLRALAYATLLRIGLLPENIYQSSECTQCGPLKLHSHRRDGTPLRNVSFIGLEK